MKLVDNYIRLLPRNLFLPPFLIPRQFDAFPLTRLSAKRFKHRLRIPQIRQFVLAGLRAVCVPARARVCVYIDACLCQRTSFIEIYDHMMRNITYDIGYEHTHHIQGYHGQGCNCNCTINRCSVDERTPQRDRSEFYSTGVHCTKNTYGA